MNSDEWYERTKKLDEYPFEGTCLKANLVSQCDEDEVEDRYSVIAYSHSKGEPGFTIYSKTWRKIGFDAGGPLKDFITLTDPEELDAFYIVVKQAKEDSDKYWKDCQA